MPSVEGGPCKMFWESESVRFGIIFWPTEFVFSNNYESGFGSPRK